MPTSVLFVCFANVCRSPLAEGIFRHLVRERDEEAVWQIDSAGTSAMSGSPPHRLSVAIGERYGFEVYGTSRQLVRDDLFAFDHVVLMDRANLRAVHQLAGPSAFAPDQHPSARVRLLRQIADPLAKGEALDVPDPIGGGPDHYEFCYRLIRRGCEALLDEITDARSSAP